MTPEMIYQGLVYLFSGAVLWGGIRADIRNQREAIASAHRRIDKHLEGHK